MFEIEYLQIMSILNVLLQEDWKTGGSQKVIQEWAHCLRRGV